MEYNTTATIKKYRCNIKIICIIKKSSFSFGTYKKHHAIDLKQQYGQSRLLDNQWGDQFPHFAFPNLLNNLSE